MPRAALVRLLGIVLALALAQRLTVLVQGAAAPALFGPLVLDQARFAEQAAAIRAGHGPGAGPYLTSPLYPYLLALVPGDLDPDREHTLLAVRGLQLVLGACTCALAALAAARRFGEPAGWVAGLSLAVLGPAMHYEAQVLVAGPLAFLLIASLACAPDEPGPRPTLRGVGAGLALGLAAALRPTALLPAAALALACVLRGQRRAAAALGLGLAAVVLPFALRNSLVGGEPVLLSAGGGFNFHVGNHVGAPGIFGAPPGYDFALDPVGIDLARRESGQELSAGQASAWWRARALEDVRSAPAAALGRLLHKTVLLLHPGEIPQLGPDDFRPARAALPVLRFPLDGRWLLLVALLAPLALGRERVARARLAAPLAMALAYGAAVVLFFVSGRFRMPLLPLAAVLAGGAVASVPALPRARVVSLALGAIALGASSLYVYRPAGPYALGEAPTTRTAEARALAAAGRYPEAADAYRRVLAQDSTHARAAFELGSLVVGPLKGESPSEKLAAWRAAEPLFDQAVRHQPRFAAAWFHLGVARLNLRRFAAAVEALERAVGLAAPADEWRAEAERALGLARDGAAGGG